MSNATKRSILRWIHLIFTIPVLGYIYGPPAEVAEYADAVRFAFIPLIFLSGFWMWRGWVFALLGAALWLAAFYLLGIGAAILSQAGLFIAWKIWLVIRARQAK